MLQVANTKTFKEKKSTGSAKSSVNKMHTVCDGLKKLYVAWGRQVEAARRDGGPRVSGQLTWRDKSGWPRNLKLSEIFQRITEH